MSPLQALPRSRHRHAAGRHPHPPPGSAGESGFVPNVFLTLAHRPDEFRAFFAYHDALMDKEGGLSKAEREMIVVATSAANSANIA